MSTLKAKTRGLPKHIAVETAASPSADKTGAVGDDSSKGVPMSNAESASRQGAENAKTSTALAALGDYESSSSDSEA